MLFRSKIEKLTFTLKTKLKSLSWFDLGLRLAMLKCLRGNSSDVKDISSNKNANVLRFKLHRFKEPRDLDLLTFVFLLHTTPLHEAICLMLSACQRVCVCVCVRASVCLSMCVLTGSQYTLSCTLLYFTLGFSMTHTHI